MRHPCQSGRTAIGLGVFKDRKGQSSLKVEVDGCPLYSASRMQKARAHSKWQNSSSYAAASATSEAMLIREVLLFMGLEVRTEVLLDSAAACGTMQTRTCRNHTKFFFESSLGTVGENAE